MFRTIQTTPGGSARHPNDNKVFTGMVEAMVLKYDKLARGVQLHNMRYPPAYDEFIHILKMYSPRAHRLVSRYFAARSERSIR
jgi:hypothetical protein